MNKSGTALGVLVLLGLAAFATSAFARGAFTDEQFSNDIPPTGEGDDMATWKVNEYPKYAAAIRDVEDRNGIPRDGLARLLYQESRYRADIISGAQRSPVGAVGIAQFMPDTGKDYGLVGGTSDGKGNYTIDKRTDPFASIAAAGRYLKALYRMFNSWEDALMAYNWGPGNVQQYNRGLIATPPRETRDYVAQITADVQFA